MREREAIELLLQDMESDRIERTVSTADKEKFYQAICAFANDFPNNRHPGYLFTGAKDNGELSGLRVSDQLSTYRC
jgi:ATP-dependent DNA helicase RecG